MRKRSRLVENMTRQPVKEEKNTKGKEGKKKNQLCERYAEAEERMRQTEKREGGEVGCNTI